MPALDADQRRHAPAGEDPDHVIGGVGDGEVVRVAHREPVHEVDLLQGDVHGLVELQADRHEDRPELGPDAALPHARDVRVHRRIQVMGVPQVLDVELAVRPPAQGPGGVVVPIEERDALQDAVDDGAVVRLGGDRRGGEPGEREHEEDE